MLQKMLKADTGRQLYGSHTNLHPDQDHPLLSAKTPLTISPNLPKNGDRTTTKGAPRQTALSFLVVSHEETLFSILRLISGMQELPGCSGWSQNLNPGPGIFIN